MPTDLQVIEPVREQSAAETIAYTINVADYPGSGDPSTISVVAIDTSDGTDKSSTVFPSGSNSVSGNIITLKALQLLTAGVTYHIRVTFTRSSNIFQPHFVVKCIY